MMTYNRAWEVGSSLDYDQVLDEELSEATVVLSKRAAELWGSAEETPYMSGIGSCLLRIRSEMMRRTRPCWYMAVWDDPEHIAPCTTVFMSHKEAVSFCANLDPLVNPRIRMMDRWTPAKYPLRWESPRPRPGRRNKAFSNGKTTPLQ